MSVCAPRRSVYLNSSQQHSKSQLMLLWSWVY